MEYKWFEEKKSEKMYMKGAKWTMHTRIDCKLLNGIVLVHRYLFVIFVKIDSLPDGINVFVAAVTVIPLRESSSRSFWPFVVAIVDIWHYRVCFLLFIWLYSDILVCVCCWFLSLNFNKTFVIQFNNSILF